MTIELRSGSSASYEWAGGSDVGACRDQNEDAFGVNPEAGIFVVADGCGGISSASFASRIAVDVLTHEADVSATAHLDPLVGRIHKAHRTIIERATSLSGADGLGSTVVALRLRPPVACIAHVGDYRAGLVHPPKSPGRPKPSLGWLNHGHRLWQEAMRCGEAPDVIASYREHLNNVVVHALGIGEHLPDVDVRYSPLKPNGLYLLCSDGIWEQLSRDEIAAIISSERLSLSERITSLLNAANEAGGHDNATAMLVCYLGK